MLFIEPLFKRALTISVTSLADSFKLAVCSLIALPTVFISLSTIRLPLAPYLSALEAINILEVVTISLKEAPDSNFGALIENKGIPSITVSFMLSVTGMD